MSENKKVDLNKVAEFIATTITELSKEELQELLDIMKDKYGLEPAVQEVVVEKESEVAEEKSEFDVKLVEVIAAKKMQVIKAWKQHAQLGLIEAKDAVTSAPVVLKEKVSKDEAEAIKAVLEEAGGIVELL